ncbi:hypothetical protein B0H19DRAFT_1157319 [Mycena capillaripes]|nr:hypothetical protein B0H19DRAFT_1157319 [Mycena capillaripes]
MIWRACAFRRNVTRGNTDRERIIRRRFFAYYRIIYLSSHSDVFTRVVAPQFSSTFPLSLSPDAQKGFISAFNVLDSSNAVIVLVCIFFYREIQPVWKVYTGFVKK